METFFLYYKRQHQISNSNICFFLNLLVHLGFYRVDGVNIYEIMNLRF